MKYSKLIFDARWIGDHGIGRFAREISIRMDFKNILKSKFIKPSNPLDLIYLSIVKLINQKKIIFSPGYNSPLFNYKNYIITIMDLNHIDVPFNSSFFKSLYYEFFLKQACIKSKLVFTISEFSKKRICEWAKVPESHVINVGCGVSDIFHEQVDPMNPGYKYFLTVSNRRPHKNEISTLYAFSAANINQKYHLVLTGDATEELLALTDELNIRDRITFLGRISEYELARWYRGCRALVFPSLYEGFGLPVVEAMASGVPVITSNVTSMPEIAGDAAVLVDPNNIQQISNAIELLADNDQFHGELVVKGLERSKFFTWDQVIEKIKSSILLHT